VDLLNESERRPVTARPAQIKRVRMERYRGVPGGACGLAEMKTARGSLGAALGTGAVATQEVDSGLEGDGAAARAIAGLEGGAARSSQQLSAWTAGA